MRRFTSNDEANDRLYTYLRTRDPLNGTSWWHQITQVIYTFSIFFTISLYSSVRCDVGCSIRMPNARSMINCGNTPNARATPNNTVTNVCSVIP